MTVLTRGVAIGEGMGARFCRLKARRREHPPRNLLQ
jgi:hypothetical protein